MKFRFAFPKDITQNWLFLALLFGVTLIPLLYGLARFPKFLGDEGIYVSQAWWLVHFKKLGPYTYWYDHFPLGWLVIGLWQKLTGGPFAFGLSVISGRVLMVLLAGVSNIFLFRIIYRLTRSLWLSFFGAVLFLLSPLSVLLHRQVLLDNVASFFLLFSLDQFFARPQSGRQVFWAGVLFSLAVLSKESLVFFLPGFWLGVLLFTGDKNRPYLAMVSVITIGFLLSLFPLLALLKGEFLPGEGHVSFLETVMSQARRGSGVPFWEPGSDFMQKLTIWLSIDPILMIVGLGSLVLNLLFRARDKRYLVATVLGLGFLAFLARGGLVLDFYLIPLIPILILSLCLLLAMLKEELHFNLGFLASPGISLGVIGLIGGFLLYHGRMLYQVDATANQIEAIEYLQRIEDKAAVIVADNFPYLDLKFTEAGEARFNRVEWYSKAESDPAIREGKLANDQDSIDVMLINNTMAYEMDIGILPFLAQARENLEASQVFPPQTVPTYAQLPQTLPYVIENLEVYERPAPAAIGSGLEISTEELVKRLVVFAPKGLSLAEEERQRLQDQSGRGVFLVGRNIESQDQVEALVEELRAWGATVAVDQEGGAVSRLPWLESTPQSAVTTEAEAFQVAKERGEQLRQLGIRMNLAPVVEIARNLCEGRTLTICQGPTFIESRAFVKDNGQLAAAMVRGYLEAGIIPVAKHFPGGLGRAAEDPHLTLPVVTVAEDGPLQPEDQGSDLRKQLEEDLAPFQAVIAAQVPAIMVTHILYPEIDKMPASASQVFINEMLRGKLGFAGLVMVDDLSMRAVKENFNVGEYAVRSVSAGADVLLCSQGEDCEAIRQALTQAVENGEISPERLNQAIDQISKIKNQSQVKSVKPNNF